MNNIKKRTYTYQSNGSVNPSSVFLRVDKDSIFHMQATEHWRSGLALCGTKTDHMSFTTSGNEPPTKGRVCSKCFTKANSQDTEQ